jgi:hypothetical protein
LLSFLTGLRDIRPPSQILQRIPALSFPPLRERGVAFG